MNREIKFRVWILSKQEEWIGDYNYESFDFNNRMRLVNSLYFPLGSISGKDVTLQKVSDNDIYAQSWVSLDECVLMQYTGLKDKIGKEIYEGDILINPKKEIGKVIFYETGFALECQRKNDTIFIIPLTEGGLKNKEIIGNVYQNPELLKSSHEHTAVPAEKK